MGCSQISGVKAKGKEFHLIRMCLSSADVSQTPSCTVPAPVSFSESRTHSASTFPLPSGPKDHCKHPFHMFYSHIGEEKHSSKCHPMSPRYIYIACYLEAEPISQQKSAKRVCSFKSGRLVSLHFYSTSCCCH